jgi:ABC-type amino acid transport substrate-binding protein
MFCENLSLSVKTFASTDLVIVGQFKAKTILQLKSLLVLLFLLVSATTTAAPKTFLGNENYAPLLFPVDGQPAGLTVDLAAAIFQAGNIDHRIELDNWSEAQTRAKNGEVDGLLQINQSPARLEIFDFSDPVLQSEFSLFVASDNYEISKFAHLKQRRVGSESKGYARAILERDPDIDVVTIDSWLMGFEMLKKGDLDALLTEKWVGEYLLSTNNVQGIKVSPYPVELSTTHIAVAKGDVELLNAINEGIATIRANGTYNAILDKWRGDTVV